MLALHTAARATLKLLAAPANLPAAKTPLCQAYEDIFELVPDGSSGGWQVPVRAYADVVGLCD